MSSKKRFDVLNSLPSWEFMTVHLKLIRAACVRVSLLGYPWRLILMYLMDEVSSAGDERFVNVQESAWKSLTKLIMLVDTTFGACNFTAIVRYCCIMVVSLSLTTWTKRLLPTSGFLSCLPMLPRRC